MNDIIQSIRCPICTVEFHGQENTPAFDAFAKIHETCRGRTLGGCACEWERLCGGDTLLSRVGDPCPDCAVRFPDGSAAKCPGCHECQEPPLSPLAIQVRNGLQDNLLLQHLHALERAEQISARGLSPGEKFLKKLVMDRLETITKP